MDSRDVALDPFTPLVFLSFLQQQSGSNADLKKEVDALGWRLKVPKDINFNGVDVDIEEDGQLQTDGHVSYDPRDFVRDLQPRVQPVWPENPEDVEVLRNVAAGLIQIADQLEHRVVAQAADNLMKKLQTSPFQCWRSHLSTEVDRMLKGGVGPGLEQLPQERMVLVLTMTLVKRVCERVPSLLQRLFSTALQYVGPAEAR